MCVKSPLLSDSFLANDPDNNVREKEAKNTSPLNAISRDSLHDNDSSNESAAVAKGLQSLIKEQSQSTLGISPRVRTDVSLKLHLNQISSSDFKLGPISITERRKIRATFSFRMSGCWTERRRWRCDLQVFEKGKK